MKFNKELDENAVPEWKEKYLDYKQGKKKLKAVGRAIKSVDKSPFKNASRQSPFGSSLRDAPVQNLFNRGRRLLPNGAIPPSNAQPVGTRSMSEAPSPQWRRQDEMERAQGLQPRGSQVDERSPLRQSNAEDGDERPRMTRYGSIIGSPPKGSSPAMDRLAQQRTQASLLELPDPALDPQLSKQNQSRIADDPEYDRPISPGFPEQVNRPYEQPRQPEPAQPARVGNAYKVPPNSNDPPRPSPLPKTRSFFRPLRSNSTPNDVRRPALFQRVMSIAGGTPPLSRSFRDNDVALEVYREVDLRQAEFFHFLDRELLKIEGFYREKENEATERLRVLREQLHIMRNQRLEEVEAEERQQQKQHQHQHQHSHVSNGNLLHSLTHATTAPDATHHESQLLNEEHRRQRIKNSVVSQMDNALDKVRTAHIGKTSQAMRDLGTPSIRLDPDNRDYGRKPQGNISYHAAKRKLKFAFIEYYRTLELLKNYSLLNHTAFRKINKKCDKTVAGSPGKEFMIEKANKAHFVHSGTTDDLMSSTEDLYARYFERGNRKMAISKLRNKGYKSFDYTASTFRAGLLGGAGLALAIYGLVYGLDERFSHQGDKHILSSYQLQIYAGYFFLVLQVLLFCFACREFDRHKINYGFIFELDPRHRLNWRQLLEMPALCLFFLGLAMNLNFQLVGGWAMYDYWPVVLIGNTVVLMVLPFQILYYKTRLWLLITLFRVSFSGLYNVEFRDLLFGDMFCSQTYAFGNIELLFCLYAKHYQNASSCTSSGSMLFGFLTTLPGIWRGLQCLRRFVNTRSAAPHLWNFGKYTCTIMSYMSLSIWRIHRASEPRLIWAFGATSFINSVYCIFWDLAYDFSLFHGTKKHPLLRKQILFRPWWYYGVMILDPILRFNWIFYVIFKDDVQHSTLVSFCIALSEVIRRGIWSLFRVENEQVANNLGLKASREPPVPYRHGLDGPQPEEEVAAAETGSPMQQKLRKVGTSLSKAHVQDYSRRKPDAQEADIPEESDEEEEDDDDE